MYTDNIILKHLAVVKILLPQLSNSTSLLLQNANHVTSNTSNKLSHQGVELPLFLKNTSHNSLAGFFTHQV